MLSKKWKSREKTRSIFINSFLNVIDLFQKRKLHRRLEKPAPEEEEDKEEEVEEPVQQKSHTPSESTDKSDDPSKVPKAEEDDDDDDDDEDDDDNNSPIPTAQPGKYKAVKGPKKKASSWKRTVAPEDEALPRKNLLKHQKVSSFF